MKELRFSKHLRTLLEEVRAETPQKLSPVKLGEWIHRASRLPVRERGFGLINVVSLLIEARRHLELAKDLLEALPAGPALYAKLRLKADIARIEGDPKQARVLIALADAAPDAPDQNERLASTWASAVAPWKRVDDSPAGKRARLAMYFRAKRRIT